MLIYCTLQMHVQQATYANELHVNVQHRFGINVSFVNWTPVLEASLTECVFNFTHNTLHILAVHQNTSDHWKVDFQKSPSSDSIWRETKVDL